MDLWHIQIPTPVALAFVAAMGYLISRWHRPTSTDIVIRSRRELKRAQAVAMELEKIAWTVRQSLAKHHASVSRFKDRVSKLGDHQTGGRRKGTLPRGGRYSRADAATGDANRQRL